ncbi:LCP family protein [Actinomyces lilanjuaniae]|uniref:LCP family protein n=1 Tax=Actinomyces lilanjuaniae TaxID=2321394 RepID=UPI001FAA20A0|nr:LCP family protein [Actinomyces lilanjuaniae]
MPKVALPHARHSSKDLGRHLARRVALCVLAVVLFLVSGVGFAWQDLQSRINIFDADSILGPNRPGDDLPDSYEGRAVNLLVLGSDTRSGDNNVDNSQGSEDVAVARSDTAMVMHISADRSRIDVVSIPRDTLVDIPSCTTLDGETTQAVTNGQFNSAFANGAGTGTDPSSVVSGAACAQRTVEDLTDIRIDDFVVVDFDGLSTMVDALGGVNLYVEEEISDPDYTGLELTQGCHTLDGATALQYSRVRHGVGDGSDISRISRQQNLMSAMARAAQSKNLLGANELYDFATSVLEALTVSKGLSLGALAGLGSSVQQVGMDNMNFVAMPTAEAPWDANRVVPTDEADDVWEALRNDQPVPDGSEGSDGTTGGDSATPSATASPDTGSTDGPQTEEGTDGHDAADADTPTQAATPTQDPQAQASQSAQAAAVASAAQQCE